MTDNPKNFSNPFLESWLSGTEQMAKAQSAWFKKNMEDEPSDDNNDLDDVLQQTQGNWQKCEEQFQAWISASQNWFEQFSDISNDDDFTAQIEALKSSISPMSFLNSGQADIDKVLKKFVEIPDFADVGIIEKKLLRINHAMKKFHTASMDFQVILSNTWSEAFQQFLHSVNDRKEPLTSSQDALQQWLATANKYLVEMQRSEIFLEAQNNLLEANTEFRQQQKEFSESWSEALLIPTRAEIDDLQLIVHELRREVRMLKRKVDTQQKNKTPEQKPKAQTKTVKKTKTKVKNTSSKK